MKWNLIFLLLTVQGQNDEGNKKRMFTTQGKLYLVQFLNKPHFCHFLHGNKAMKYIWSLE